MAGKIKADLLESRGAERLFESPIIGVAASRNGAHLAALTSDGEGVLLSRSTLRQPEQWQVVALHEGGLCLAQGCEEDSFLSGGEDGCVMRLSASGGKMALHQDYSWIDCLASTPNHYAFSAKKDVMLCSADMSGDAGVVLKTLPHPSSLSGLTFDAKGRRLAASHYNGVSLWFVQARESNVRSLNWQGSHTGLTLHPGGEAIVTSMQENELHGWRLSDGHNMRMSGYPRKIRSMSFSHNGRWLATSGSDAAILWPFFGGGPMGKAPCELARLPSVFSSCVAMHPKENILAVGYEDGTVLLVEIPGKTEIMPQEGEDRILPVCLGATQIALGGKVRGAVSALAFTPQGGALIFGTEGGVVGTIDLSAQK